jgi:hypothetical protein
VVAVLWILAALATLAITYSVYVSIPLSHCRKELRPAARPVSARQ